MRKHFPGFYPHRNSSMGELIDKATIVLDVDALLDLFKLHPDDANCFISLLKENPIEGKVWMPYDVAWLYHKRMNEEIQNQIDNVNSVLSHLSACREAIEDSKKFPYLSRDLIAQLKDVINSITEACQKDSEYLLESLMDDAELKESIQSLFEGKIGEEYNDGCLKNIYDEGSERYQRCEPPGYESEEVKENRIRYHDLIVWKQILAYAWNKENRCRGIIYVTGKVRPDWYYIVNGKIISTRHELINEFLKGIAGDNDDNFFYCFSSKQFADIITSGKQLSSEQPDQYDHLKKALGEEIVYASVNANGIANNQTKIPANNE